jgi:hypothetical protein
VPISSDSCLLTLTLQQVQQAVVHGYQGVHRVLLQCSSNAVLAGAGSSRTLPNPSNTCKTPHDYWAMCLLLLLLLLLLRH